MADGPPGAFEASEEEPGPLSNGAPGAAPAGGQPASSDGDGAEPPPAGGEHPGHHDGQGYWFSEDDDDEADWLDAADDEDLGLDEDLFSDGELEEWNGFDDDDDDLMDDDEDEWEGDGSQSSDAPEQEATAQERLEAGTAGRFVCPGWASYPIPTASHHFQSADALALSEAAGPGGGLLAATCDAQGVAVWLLPAGGDVAALGPCKSAIRLGGFQGPRDAFSLAFSPDGRWLATGGEGALLSLYSVDPLAPPRPQLPPGRLPLIQGLNFFYTPLLLPQQLRQLQQARAQAAGTSAAAQAQAAAQAAGEGQPQCTQPSDRLQEEQREEPGPAVGPMPVDRHTEHVMDLAIDALQRRLEAGVAVGPGSAAQRQLRRSALSDEVEQNRGFIRAVMAQDMRMLRTTAPAGQQLHIDNMDNNDPAALQHELATSYRNFVQRAGAAVQLLQAIGRQASASTVHDAAAAAAASAVAEAAVGPASGVVSGQLPQAQQLDKRAGKRPVGGGQGADAVAQQAGQQLQDTSRAAAVQLRGIVAVGLEPQQARRTPFIGDGMLNGVRFGMVAGRQRLLAADQTGYVYVFDLPSTAAAAEAGGSSGACHGSGSSELQAVQLLCSGLGEPSPHWCTRPVNFFRTSQHPLGARVQQQQPAEAPRPGQREGTRAAVRAAAAAGAQGAAPSGGGASGLHLTAALGPFPTPCNLAAASPDGRWIAAVGDAQAVYLADQAAGFSWRRLPFDLVGSRYNVEHGLDVGSQYCAWNASSSLLAASSDALHAVFVWEPRSGQLVMRVEGHARPCLSLGFAPWNDRLLVYAEESNQIHMREVPAAKAGCSAVCEQNARDDLVDTPAGVQLLRLPIVPAAAPPPGPLAPPVEAVMQAQLAGGSRRRGVTGMAPSQQGDLLVTTRQGVLLRYLSSQPWQPGQHRLWPPAFRAAVRALLLCAHRQQQLASGQPGQAAGLWLLPLPILQLIIAAAAGKRSDWLPQPATGHAGGAAPPAAMAASGGTPADWHQAARWRVLS